jgi:hypothetical protein
MQRLEEAMTVMMMAAKQLKTNRFLRSCGNSIDILWYLSDQFMEFQSRYHSLFHCRSIKDLE